ncbi:class I SAM-dependent methyltransferase [Nitrospirillum iridis]|uniref:Spermidine synthase n=1 Tax=Nitrospirillum iridis TaxID=765888 RepID=A0A7X0AUX9_9PROT|nr:class I SAM-dependent methyltransferase [Nitrospirillum iridis]MBB6250533.1 hypothetical protein [Nitrospirillum iridis]
MTSNPPPLPIEPATHLFMPVYRPFQGQRWTLRLVPLQICAGYWSPARMIQDMAVLMRQEGDGLKSWMSMTPMELESQEIGCLLALGHTVVMGMGMGWATCIAALNPAVTAVTVVEFDPEVLAVIEQSDIFAQLPAEAAAKITVRQGDAYHWRPDDGRPVDTLLADIWLGLHKQGREKEVRGMVANTGAKAVYFWGQEMNMAWRLKELGLPVDADGIARVVEEWGLPLLGPGEPDYAAKAAAAAAHWLYPPDRPPF